jgi:hypothetical protein
MFPFGTGATEKSFLGNRRVARRLPDGAKPAVLARSQQSCHQPSFEATCRPVTGVLQITTQARQSIRQPGNRAVTDARCPGRLRPPRNFGWHVGLPASSSFPRFESYRCHQTEERALRYKNASVISRKVSNFAQIGPRDSAKIADGNNSDGPEPQSTCAAI